MELVGECGYANSGREGVQGDRSRGRARPGRAGAHRSSSSSFSSSALFGSDVIFLTTGLLSFLGGSNDVPIYQIAHDRRHGISRVSHVRLPQRGHHRTNAQG